MELTSTGGVRGGGGRLGSRLGAARDRAFVGRAAETALFRAMLAGEPDAAPVLFVHGPGGIGKSTLLRRFAREAAASGRPVFQVDARTTAPTPEAFQRAAADVLDVPDAVLLIDTFEMCQGLEGWLWERFLPELPLGAVAVLAGRTPPDSRWTADSGWADHLALVRLEALSWDDAVTFLNRQGVPAHVQGDVWDFTGGNPLALSLAAAVTVEPEPGRRRRPGNGAGLQTGQGSGGGLGAGDRSRTRWKPDQDVIAVLLSRLANDPPSPLHRQALEVCAHAYVTSEDLIRAMFGEQAPELFAWLRAQPYVETAATGVFPHDVVRGALEADLRWRDPEGFVALHKRMHDHLLDRLRRGPAHLLMDAVAALMYMYRTDGHMPEVHEWQAPGLVQEYPYTPGAEADVLDLTARAEGPESAEIARRWLELQPAAFRLHRSTRTGRTVSFTATLWLGADKEETGSSFDPVLAAVWRYARRHGPVRDGERIAVTRYLVHPDRYHRPSAPMTLAHWRAMGEVWRGADRLSHHIAVYRDDGYWNSHMTHYATPPVADPVRVGAHAYRLFARDYRTEPLVAYLAANTDAMLADGAPRATKLSPRGASGERAGQAVLSRDAFGAAVRDALRSLGSPNELRCNPLARSRVAVAHGGDLARLLRDAAQRLPDERGGERRHRAFTATYGDRPAAQQAAAARLGLPFSTYRRHLKEAVDRITDLLWEQELTGPVVAGDGE
ncbi:ATP-binding protein [Streptomyces swartbergensis]|uniref:ATP-binding protein n=1 Tax=Streptomyces swartbergensis TaxID=487165 RepID=UPI0038152F6A